MENIYKKYRKIAGLTQEKAAEHLNISIDTIKRYENGTYIPPNDIARRMCLLYGDMKLAYEHLENSQVGAMVLPPLKDKDLCCSTLGFLNSLQHIDKKKAELISIASDFKKNDKSRTYSYVIYPEKLKKAVGEDRYKEVMGEC